MFKKVLLTHLIFAVIRVLYVLYRDIDLSTEEAQYWLWSKHLDISYYSKPPLIAYLNFISTSILGDTEIGVRINAIILGFLTAIGVYLFTKYLFKDEKLAFFSSLFIYFTPSYDIASIIFLTDTPLAFFYLLLIWFFYKAVNSKKPSDWILTGIFGGLAFYSKFSAVLFIIPAFMYLFLFKRELLKEKWLYISILIAGLFTLPIIYWNIINDFVSFKHVEKLAGVTENSGINLKHLGDYILGQIGINSPFLFPFMVYSVYRSFKDKDEKLIYLSLNSVLIFFLFMIISLKKNVEANWPAFAYIPLYILTAYYIYIYHLKKAIIPMFLSTLGIVIIFYTPILDKVGLTQLLPPKKDPTKRLVGWKSMGEVVYREIENLNTNKYFIFSDSYHISSELAFYVKGNPQTYCIRIDRRMNQFDLWEGISKFENKGYIGIYVADHPITDRIKNGFDEISKEFVYKVKYRGEFVKDYYIYVLKNYRKIEEDHITSF
ncbi:MAG: glycosyltransferase family 39 protein [Hydrogenothermaceae bacterium]